MISTITNNCKLNGLEEKLASIRSIGFHVLDMHKEEEILLQAIVEESLYAVERDGARCIILGCTAMSKMARAVEYSLIKKGINVPVIDPSATAIRMAQLLVEMDNRHSKRTYPFPPKKMIYGYGLK